MPLRYDVRSAFQSPGLGVWICPDTASLVSDLPAGELKHALDTGHVREVDVPTEAALAKEAERIEEGRQAALEATPLPGLPGRPTVLDDAPARRAKGGTR